MEKLLQHEELIKNLCDCGFETYIVGGCVRDLLSGMTLREIKDIDITTSAPPEKIVNIFEKDHVVSDINGTTFRVVLVDGYEIAQFRTDISDGGIKKFHKTIPARTLDEDLERRDLTINSIAMCPFTGDIHDIFGGIEDLKNKVIRFTGDPDKRIKEDAERIIRAPRFLAKLGDRAYFEENTLKALVNNIDRIKLISGNKHRLEILKAMKLKQPSIFFEALHMIGGLQYIFPSLERCVAHFHGKHHIEDIFEHCMIVGDSIPPDDPILRLAGFLHDVGKPESWNGENFASHEHMGAKIVRKELENLKFSNDEIDKICGLIDLHMRSVRDAKPKVVRRVIKDLKSENINFSDWLTLKVADRIGNIKREKHTFAEISKMIDDLDREIYQTQHESVFKITDLKITGFDIMKILNVKPGKIIGDTLKYLFEIVLDDPELNDYETLKKLVKEKI